MRNGGFERGRPPVGARGSRVFTRMLACLALLAACAAGNALAQTQTLSILIDRDSNAATGCTVAVGGQSMGGVETRIDATIAVGASPTINALTRAECSGGSFGTGTGFGGSAAFGAQTGLDGADVVEFGMPLAALLDPSARRTGLGFVVTGSNGTDVLFSSDGAAGGPGIGLFGPASPIPGPGTVALLAVVLLVLLVGLRAARRARRWLALSLFALVGLAWASHFIVDGQVSDWGTIPPIANSPAASGSGVDLRAAFAVRHEERGFVRVDLFGLRSSAPTFMSANTGTLTVGSAGSLAITATGLPAPAITLSGGSLPAGISFDAASATLSGTAAAGTGGSYALQFTASNDQGSAVQAYTLTILEAPAITSAASTTFGLGQPGTFNVTANGFPAATFSVAGTLPSGITFDSATGLLSGTAAAGTAGDHPLSFTASNAAGSSAPQAFLLTIIDGPSFTSAAATTFTVGQAGSFSVTASGTPAPTLALTGGTLPGGLSFTPATGELAGTPVAGTGGTHALTFTATNSEGSLPQAFTLTINEAPSITSANAATFLIGTAGSFSVIADGFPASSFTIGGDPLPAGVGFDGATGVLSGTPAAATGGTYALTFTATNAAGSSAPQAFTLTVQQGPTFTSAAATTFTVGSADSFTVTATGTPTPTLALTAGTLPAGIGFDAGTGVLSGTPLAGTGGTHTLEFTASNAIGPVVQAFTLTVTEAPAITSANATTFLIGTPGSFSVTADGFPASTFAIGGDALPAGVSFDGANGLLSGTPAAATGGSYALTFTATNPAGSSATQAFTLTVQQGPTFTSAAATTFTVGSAGSFTVTAFAEPAATLSLSAGTLPAGITFTPATGVLAGTPVAGTGGTHALEFTATNAVGAVAQAFTLTINEAPAITSADNTAFDIGVAGSFTVTASGFPAPSFAIGSCTPALPNSITFDAATGVLSGTAVDGQGGSYACTLTASNAAGDATQPFTLTINLLASKLGITTQPSASVQSGVAFAQQPVIQLLDAVDLPVAKSGVVVTASIATGGGSLGGNTTAVTDAAGVATFTDLSIAGTAGDHTLAFSAPALAGVTSATIAVTAGAASQLGIAAQPSASAQSGIAFDAQPTLQLQDASGNPVAQAGVTVTAAIASGGGTLGGTASANTDAAGLASFSNLSISGTIGDRILSFSAAGLTGATSGTISLTAGAAAALQISTQPSASAQSGVAFAQQPAIQLVDASGNLVAQAGVAVGASIASGGGTLGGTGSANTDAAGLATFTDLSIAGTIGDRTLAFAAAGLAGNTSNTIALSAGVPAALAFAVQPSNTVASAPITPAVEVAITDASGNTVTSATDSVSIAIGSNPSGGTLAGTTAVAAVGGVATFSDLSINLVGTGYTLAASSGSLAGATSSAFDVIHGPLDHFLVEAAGGGPIGAQLTGTPFNVSVTAQDAFNNTVTSFTGTVGFSSTPGGGISAGATSAAFTAGALASHAITFGTSGSFTLTATRIAGSESGTSNAFDVQAPPTAVNEGPAPTSSPGQPFHAFFSSSGSPQTFSLTAPGVLANDNLGFPAATITSFGADSLGGTVTTHAAGSTVSPLPGPGITTGSLSVAADGSVMFTPPDDFTGNFVFRYRLTNVRGSSDGQVTIAVGARPAAVNDTYSPVLVGNVPINTATSTQFKVTANDAGDAKVLAITAQSNGTATLNADETFTFRPNVGFEGAASFSYTVSNGFGTSAPATVGMTVANPIWFINAGAPGGGDGRYDTPFNALASFAAINNGTGSNPAASDRIFLYTGSYAGPLTLLSAQRLIGQGATASLSSIAGVTWPADAGAEPAMSGTAPTLTATNAVALTLANIASASAANNTLRGFNFANVGATGTALAGTSFGTVTLSEVGITTDGRALNLATGTLAGSFPALSSSGGANNVLLSSVGSSGTVTLGAGGNALSGATGNAFEISGGNGSFTYPGNITNSTALAVRIAGKTGGTVTLSGSINPAAAARGIEVAGNSTGSNTITFSGAQQRISSGAAAGVSLTTNAGATIAFTGGGLEVGTTTGSGFVATGGAASITVTGAANTITSAGGTALNVQGSTIGAAGLTFRAISANGGTNGILLSNTGAGSLAVTGTGSAGTGGTIQNTSAHGISLESTTAPSFTSMSIQSTGGSGINGTGVVGFSFVDGVINNSGNALGESNIAFNGNGTLLGNNLSGLLTVTGSTLTNAFDHGIHVEGDAGAVTHAVIQNNTITSTTSTATSKGSGIQLIGTGSGSTAASLARATITGNTVRNFPSNAGIQVNYGNASATGPSGFAGQPGNATNLITITGNTVRGASSAIPFGTHAILTAVSGGNGGQRSAGNFAVSNNGSVGSPIGDNLGITLGIGNNGFADATATIANNVIVANNTFGSGGISGGNGVVIGCAAGSCESPDLSLVTTGNSISQTDGNGILLVGRGTTGLAKLGIRQNTVAAPLGGTRPGIRIDAGNTSANSDDAVCLELSQNTTGGSGGHEGIGLRKQGTLTTTHDFGVEGMAATSSPGVETHVGNGGQNPGAANGSFGTAGVLLISASSGFSNCSSAP